MVKQNWISIDKVKLTTARKTPSPRTDLEQEFGNLLEELRDQDDEARKATINKLRTFVTRKRITEITLDKSDYAKITPVLIRFLKEDLSSTNLLLERLGKSISDYLIDALENKNPNVRKNVIYLLGKFKEIKAVDPLLEILQNDDEELVKSQAMWALGEIGDKGATELILRILKDENSKNRTHAIFALKELKDPKVIDPLVSILNNENEDVGRAAVETLGEFDDERAVKQLIRSLDYKHLRGPALRKLSRNTESWIINLIFEKTIDAEYKLGIDLFKILEKMLNEQTMDVYIQALKNEHWQIRRKAATLLGRFCNKLATEQLIESLKDGNQKVKNSAVWALGEIADERAIKPIVNMFKEDIEMETVVKALIEIGNKSEQAIIDFMENNKDIISYPTRTLARIGSKKSEDLLISGLENPIEEVKIAVIHGLGRLKSTKAIEPLIERLNDESWMVRKSAESAVKELSVIGGERVFNAFVENLVDNEGYVNGDIAEALGSIEDLRAVDSLIQSLNHGYNNKVVEALGKLGDPRAVQPIMDTLTYSPEDMPSAVYALVKLGEKGIEAIFEIIREGGYPFVVEPAAEVLSEVRDIKYLDTIIEFLSYENNGVPNYVIETVRGCAIEALVNFDDPRVVDILMETLKDSHAIESVRRCAIEALANFDDPRVVDILMETLKDNHVIESDNLIMKWNVVEALGKIKDPCSIKPIIEVLSDGIKETKKYVIKALLKFDKETVVDTLIEMLKSKDAKVKEETVWVLGRMKASKALGPLEDLYETEMDGRVLFAIGQVLKDFQ
ncbi:MAG: HEAT repeat domain-containing protein [Candidatus Heimdallarchaeaceae archaeon]